MGSVTGSLQSLRLVHEQLRLARLPRRRQTPEELADRVPPGQYVERDFPVLTAGPTPRVDTDAWGLRIDGMVGAEQEWTWDEFHSLPFENVPCDIHCVTKWSKLGTSFGGVSLDTLLEPVRAEGRVHDGLLVRRLHDQPGRSPTSPAGRRGS